MLARVLMEREVRWAWRNWERGTVAERECAKVREREVVMLGPKGMGEERAKGRESLRRERGRSALASGKDVGGTHFSILPTNPFVLTLNSTL